MGTVLRLTEGMYDVLYVGWSDAELSPCPGEYEKGHPRGVPI